MRAHTQGGIPDVDLVARTVLQDWNGGKIPYFTEPPEETRLLDAAVVAGYSAEFKCVRNEAGGQIGAGTWVGLGLGQGLGLKWG